MQRELFDANPDIIVCLSIFLSDIDKRNLSITCKSMNDANYFVYSGKTYSYAEIKYIKNTPIFNKIANVSYLLDLSSNEKNYPRNTTELTIVNNNNDVCNFELTEPNNIRHLSIQGNIILKNVTHNVTSLDIFVLESSVLDRISMPDTITSLELRMVKFIQTR